MNYIHITRKEVVSNLISGKDPLETLQQFMWTLGYNDVVDAIDRIKNNKVNSKLSLAEQNFKNYGNSNNTGCAASPSSS